MNIAGSSANQGRKGFAGQPTRAFLEREGRDGIEALVNPVIKLLTEDAWLARLYRVKESLVIKLAYSLLDIVLARQERKLGVTQALRVALFGKVGSKGKRSTLAHLLTPVLDAYFAAWKKQQAAGIVTPRQLHRVEPLPDMWSGWKQLREEICPGFVALPNVAGGEFVHVLPGDTMTPKERINRLVEFKDVDRVGFGPTLSGHAVAFAGAQPAHAIGGLWQSFIGPGERAAKATINAWIRLGGMDFFPASMFPLAVPIPEAHSPFYFSWIPPPSNVNYEQFIEEEAIKAYDGIENYGLTSLAREVSKRVVFHALVGVREMLKASVVLGRYFPTEFMKQFESYAGSICAPWDVIPMARGFRPFMRDLVKNPSAVIEAFDFFEPGLTELAIALAKLTKAKYILIGNSRGSSSWISPRLFESVFWPSMKRAWMRIVKAGFKVCAHLDNDWTGDMEYMLELPKHSGFFHLDQSDLPRVRETIGDHFCLMGNLQPAITVGAGPDIVYKKTVELIKACGTDGGYIVATGCEPPANVPVANYYAMKRAIRDAGYLRR
ncbi:MAG: uroporphyrinogen decarboxylase family protein [Candidatus Sigynarchaeota archaeon]